MLERKHFEEEWLPVIHLLILVTLPLTWLLLGPRTPGLDR